MKESISVSVIIPVYNVELYLPNLIDSLSEKISDWIEFIFINDGSSDGSALILEQLSKSPHFQIVTQENKGVAAARNLGLSIARGEYVCFIDPDDDVNNHYFENLYQVAVDSHADLVLCNWASRDLNNLSVHHLSQMKDPMDVPQSIVVLQMLQSNGILAGALWGKLFSKKLFIKNNFPNQRTNSDYVPCFTAIGNANKIAYCYDSVYYYTVDRSTSLQHTQSVSDLDYLVSTRDELLAFVASNFPSYLKVANVCYVKVLLEACFQSIKSSNIKNKRQTFYKFRSILTLHKADLHAEGLTDKEKIRCYIVLYCGFSFTRFLLACRIAIKKLNIR